MRQTAGAKKRAETRTLLAATLVCYLASFACVLTISYSLAALTAPSFMNARVAFETEARP